MAHYGQTVLTQSLL